eukprot:356399-Chlamydomonas_euryale.AAC.2
MRHAPLPEKALAATLFKPQACGTRAQAGDQGAVYYDSGYEWPDLPAAPPGDHRNWGHVKAGGQPAGDASINWCVRVCARVTVPGCARV